LFDIHGNLPALEAVLADVEREAVDLVVVGGDVASGPLPAETLDRLIELGSLACFVRGNADRELVDAYELWAAGALTPSDDAGPAQRMSSWAAQRLTASHRELLATFRPSVSVEMPGLGEIRFCHATPRSDEEIITAATTDEHLAEALTGVSASVIVAGHTHVQLDRLLGGQRFVNAGSVGMPYEDAPGAYWAVIDEEVSLRVTAYDYASAAEAIRGSDYPDAEEMVRECLLAPIGSAEATRYFDELARARQPAFAPPAANGL
jgi:predicted phosphodiesterase